MDVGKRDYLVLVVTGIMTMFVSGISSPIIPLYTLEFTSSLILIGLVVSGYFAVRMFFEIPFGTLSDRMGPRKPLILGRILATGGIILSLYATGAYELIVARALWGIGDAAFFCVSTAYIASVFPIRERGRALGVFVSIETIGSFLGQSFGGVVASVFSYRGVFAISVPLSAVVLSLLIFFRGTRSLPSGRVERKPTQGFRVMMTPTLVAVSLIVFVVMFRNNGITSNILPLYLTNFLGISLPMYGLLMAFGTVGSMIGNFFGGWLSDRMGRVRIILVGLLLLALSTYLLSTFTTFTPLVMVMVLQGYAWGSMYSVTPVLIVDSVPGELRGMAVGTYRTFFDLGGLLGPILMSAVADSLGFIPSFYVGTALILSNITLIPFLQKRPQKIP
jgi:DHA1 family solute carrier family 18 vesicular amine transporter 1/2